MCKFYRVPLFNMYLFDLTTHFKYAQMDVKYDLVNLCIHFAEGRVKIRTILLNASLES